MEPDRLDRAEDEFIDEYLAEHPDASEFEAALMFWTLPDEITMHREEYDEHSRAKRIECYERDG